MSIATLDAQGVVTACPACGQRNRHRHGRLGEAIRCGRCRTDLPAVAEPIQVEDATAFDALVRGASVPVLVDFWAPWCAPCRAVAPELARVAAAEAGRLVVVKVNTEDLPDLAGRFGIRSIPTMAVFSGGREVGRTSGARPAASIQAFVRDAVAGSGARP